MAQILTAGATLSGLEAKQQVACIKTCTRILIENRPGTIREYFVSLNKMTTKWGNSRNCQHFFFVKNQDVENENKHVNTNSKMSQILNGRMEKKGRKGQFSIIYILSVLNYARKNTQYDSP